MMSRKVAWGADEEGGLGGWVRGKGHGWTSDVDEHAAVVGERVENRALHQHQSWNEGLWGVSLGQRWCCSSLG